jgi:methionyl-tRNA formyltransferase
MEIESKIDEGNILLQEELPIFPNENAGCLHDRLMEMGAKLVVKTLDGLAENSITERPQPHVEHPKNAYKIFKEDTKIDWTKNSKEIHQFILGMSPYPAAFTTLKIGDEEKGLKIFGGEFKVESHDKVAGTLDISKNEFKVVKFRKNFELVAQKLKDVEEKDRVRNFQPPISGELIMKLFQIGPCAEIGTLKTKIKDAILEGIIENEYDAAYKYLMEIAEEIGMKKA